MSTEVCYKPSGGLWCLDAGYHALSMMEQVEKNKKKPIDMSHKATKTHGQIMDRLPVIEKMLEIANQKL